MSKLIIAGNALPSDVRSGKIFSAGVNYNETGTLVPLNTSDATATTNDIIATKTAYGSLGSKITGTIPLLGSEEYAGWRRATVGIPSMSGRLHLKIPKGAYLTGTDQQSGDMGVFADDINFIAENILAGKAPFGLIGTLNPLLYATGSVTCSSSTAAFATNAAPITINLYYVTVSGLTFTPKLIIVSNAYKVCIYNNGYNFGANATFWANMSMISNGKPESLRVQSPAYINASGFLFPAGNTSSEVYTYYVYG